MFVKQPRLTTAEIIERYLAGESRTLVALRAKVSDQHVRQILMDAGIPLRTMDEARRLGVLERYKRARRPASA
jgi:hypothetical protein